MKQRTRRLARTVPAFVLAVLLILSLMPVTHAAEVREQVYEGEIELTGTFKGKFSLDSSDLYLFKLENMAPGDSWKGKIRVKNSASDKMEISIISIVSKLEDTKLFDALQMKIMIGDEEVYSGSYGGTKEPISKFYAISPGKTITFDVEVTFPKECGNEYQGAKMDSTWTFEGRYYKSSSPTKDEPDKIQTGVDMTVGSSQNATWLFVSLLCLASGALAIVLAKRGTSTKKKGRE